MSLYGWGDVTIGRTVLREVFDASETGGSTVRGLALKGQEACPPNPRPTVVGQHANLVALEDGLVLPVAFTAKPELDCYAMTGAVTSVLDDWGGAAGRVTATWTAALTRCGSGNETDLESRLTGTRRLNDFAVTGESTHAPPIAHYAYFTDATVPSLMTRTGEDGALTVYRGLTAGVFPRWGCAPASYGGARVRALDTSPAAGPFELDGTDRQAPATTWRLSNGLVRVSPGAAAGTLLVGAYTGAAWHDKAWDVSVAGVALGAPDAATVVHNTMEHTVLRLTWRRAPGRATLDLGLRRGSRGLELYLQTGTAATLAVALHSAATGAQTSGYVTATANDADGNRYVVGSAKTFTASTSGGISKAAVAVLDVVVGVAAGGSGAVSGDAAADVYAQYIGALPEAVYAVRR